MSTGEDREAIELHRSPLHQEVMMPKRYMVRLSNEEQQNLQDLVSTGKTAAYKIKHAHILLNVDVNGPGWTDEEAATVLSPQYRRQCARALCRARVRGCLGTQAPSDSTASTGL
jgi:RNA:NAD 2'-phosphotransferase (TPT1/KptA family)